jgi:hypothetical protein
VTVVACPAVIATAMLGCCRPRRSDRRDRAPPGALERIGSLLADRQAAADKLADTDGLDELELTGLAISVPGVSAVGAAAIL